MARRAALCALLGACALAAPASAGAAMMTFGSPLGVPATLDTANNLGYAGFDPVLNVHVFHDGADTALWNSVRRGRHPHLARGRAGAVGRRRGLRRAGGGRTPAAHPVPLPVAHADRRRWSHGRRHLTAVRPAGVRHGHARRARARPAARSRATRPTTMCVAAGGLVDFNDEGGFDPSFYPSGVRYEVIGAVGGSTMPSYILANGTNNGDTLSAMNVTATNGFVAQSERGADAPGDARDRAPTRRRCAPAGARPAAAGPARAPAPGRAAEAPAADRARPPTRTRARASPAVRPAWSSPRAPSR